MQNGVSALKKDVILYFGMGFLPESNAVACRQQAFAKMIIDSGYTPILIGVSKDMENFNTFKKDTFNDIDCYSIKYPSSLKDKIVDSFKIVNTFKKIFEDIGIDRIKCFIMQDYQFNTMHKINKFCIKNEIAYVADLMDWFTPTSDYSLSKNIFKSFDMFVRAHFVYPHLKNKIHISHSFFNRFKNKRNNDIIIPCTCKDIKNDTSITHDKNDGLEITFAGEPGKRFQKEKIDWLIKALYENKSKIKVNIIGITKDVFISRSPSMEKYLTNMINFHGRLPRSHCVSFIENSDFSIIVRLKNKLTTYGFSSKICESFACGTPVIATDTSDNKIYIKDSVNGFVCNADYESLKELLYKVEQLDSKVILQMRSNIMQNNPLSTEVYGESFSSFIKNLIV